MVLPAPVPPETRNASRCRDQRGQQPGALLGDGAELDQVGEREHPGARARAATAPCRAATPGPARRGTGCRRPAGRRRRARRRRAAARPRPPAAARAGARRRRPRNRTSVRSSPAPRSRYTSSGPLTSTSVTPGSRSSGSSGPAPTTSRRSVSWTASTVASPTGLPALRSAAATRWGVSVPGSRASRSRTRSTRSAGASVTCGEFTPRAPGPATPPAPRERRGASGPRRERTGPSPRSTASASPRWSPIRASTGRGQHPPDLVAVEARPAQHQGGAPRVGQPGDHPLGRRQAGERRPGDHDDPVAPHQHLVEHLVAHPRAVDDDRVVAALGRRDHLAHRERRQRRLPAGVEGEHAQRRLAGHALAQ